MLELMNKQNPLAACTGAHRALLLWKALFSSGGGDGVGQKLFRSVSDLYLATGMLWM